MLCVCLPLLHSAELAERSAKVFCQRKIRFIAIAFGHRPSSTGNIVTLQPTNDLDVMTVERLETLLQGWPGCLVLASHDRALLESTASRLLVLEGDGPVRLFDGLYSQVQRPLHCRHAREGTLCKLQFKCCSAIRFV